MGKAPAIGRPVNSATCSSRLAREAFPAEVAAWREGVRLALAAAILHLSPRQRAALILCEVLRWRASEAAVLLGTSIASVTRVTVYDQF